VKARPARIPARLVPPDIKEQAMRVALVQGYSAAQRFCGADKATIFRWVRALTAEEREKYLREAYTNLAGTLRERYELAQAKALEKLTKKLDDPHVQLRDLAICLKTLTEGLRVMPPRTVGDLDIGDDRQHQVEAVRHAAYAKALQGDSKAMDIALKVFDPTYKGDAPAVQINIAQIESMSQQERQARVSALLDQVNRG